MTRVLIVTVFSVIISALWQCFALIVPMALNIFLIAPLALAFSLQFFRPYETALLSMWVGAIVDIQGGLPIGLSMLLMLGLFFFLEASSIFSPRLSLFHLSLYAGILSLIYRLTFFFLCAIFYSQNTNIYLGHLVLGPIVDWFMSLALFPLLLKSLFIFKGLDQSEFHRNLGTSE